MNLSATPYAALSAHLLDLLRQLEGHEVKLILVGGFGLLVTTPRPEGPSRLYSVP